MCVVQTVNRFIAKVALVASVNRGSLWGLWGCADPQVPPASSVKDEAGPGRKPCTPHLGRGGSALCSLSAVSAPVALLGSHYLTIWPVFLRDGHVHSPNCRVLFELA